MARNSNKPAKKQKTLDSNATKEPDYFEGERLAHLLKLIQRGIETARLSDGESLPEKIWFKKQFAIGVNDVTRVLERMKPYVDRGGSPENPDLIQQNPRGPPVRLQAVLLAADCNPRMLTKHLPGLAASRNVRIVYVRDNKRGSLRLGEAVKLKTALAIGVKARGNAINRLLEGIFRGDEVEVLEASDAADEERGGIQRPVKL